MTKLTFSRLVWPTCCSSHDSILPQLLLSRLCSSPCFLELEHLHSLFLLSVSESFFSPLFSWLVTALRKHNNKKKTIAITACDIGRRFFVLSERLWNSLWCGSCGRGKTSTGAGDGTPLSNLSANCAGTASVGFTVRATSFGKRPGLRAATCT